MGKRKWGRGRDRGGEREWGEDRRERGRWRGVRKAEWEGGEGGRSDYVLGQVCYSLVFQS